MCYGYDGAGDLRRSLQTRSVNRRGFLRGAIGVGAGAGLAIVGAAGVAVAAPGGNPDGKPGHGTGDKKGRKVPAGLISIQLYTLRSIMNGDGVDATLASLADIGFTKVELAGLYGRTPAALRATLDDLGITPSSSHDGISGSPAALESKIAGAVTLGQSYINVPYLASNVADDWRMWADQMNAEAAVALKAGLKYGYHNHAHEFTTDLGDGLTPWEILTDRFDQKLVHLEVDLYWAVTGGFGVGAADPVQFAIDVIHDAPQKVLQYHVKDRDASGDFADLGTGEIDFARIFKAHQVKEYAIEQDQPDVTPLQSAEVGYDYLRAVRY